MAFRFTEAACVICRIPFAAYLASKPVRVKSGLPKLIASSVDRGDSGLTAFLKDESSVVYVHGSCRREYTYIKCEKGQVLMT